MFELHDATVKKIGIYARDDVNNGLSRIHNPLLNVGDDTLRSVA